MSHYREQFQDLYELHVIGKTYRVPFERFVSDLMIVMRALEGQGKLSLDELVLCVKSTYDVSRKLGK